MRDALVLEQCEERRASGDAIHEVLPCPRPLPSDFGIMTDLKR
jgi:hypothetical protein